MSRLPDTYDRVLSRSTEAWAWPALRPAEAGVSSLSEEARALVTLARSRADQLVGPTARDRARLLRRLSLLWAAACP